MEAAQQAIASPLLDNVSISGATGVLVNITGGQDLTLGEVTQINDIVHDAVGDDAEIIFGAVHEPAMMNEIRVTVIATGFDRQMQGGVGNGVVRSVTPATPAPFAAMPTSASFPSSAAAKGSPSVLPFPTRDRPTPRPVAPPARPTWEGATPRPPRAPSVSPSSGAELDDMEIPTFIRRQMD
jgi:cell division protein FtsZ